MSPVQAALRFAAARPEVSAVICGVTSSRELEQIIDAYGTGDTQFDWSSCALKDPGWLDPSRLRAAAPASQAAR
jgi:hypothetical protein